MCTTTPSSFFSSFFSLLPPSFEVVGPQLSEKVLPDSRGGGGVEEPTRKLWEVPLFQGATGEDWCSPSGSFLSAFYPR